MADFIKIYNENPNAKEIAKVVKVLKADGLVIYPTDTVYGLGCDIMNSKALEKIAKIKGIKIEKAKLSFICNDLSHLSDYVKQIDSPTFKILKRAYSFCSKIINSFGFCKIHWVTISEPIDPPPPEINITLFKIFLFNNSVFDIT